MSDTDTLRWIERIVRNEVDSDAIALALDTLPADVEGWDSLAHVGIIVAVEKRAGRQFTTEQIDGIKTVGDLVRLAEVVAAR
ncbi:acyl carrier protein [uncultured Phenylobacterium sp.]|uniref:acyl carrier protein n=1 Tax=uncultured Phenylobacterium sp. TaxID=349273 RepID=UPI0025EE8BA9|nr:acyl carrier protein [uncultured Phenylobacterium sp.]